MDETLGPTIKLKGRGVSDGIIPIAELKTFLDGIEKSAKYFMNSTDSTLTNNEYSIEVTVQPGSVIVTIIGIVGVGVATNYAIPYIKTAAEQIAKNDIGDKTSKDIILLGMKRMRKTIQIAKHVGGMGKRSFPEAKVKFKEQIVLPNEKGEKLEVTKEELDLYSRTPRDLFKNLVMPVKDNVALFIDDGQGTEDRPKPEKIDNSQKQYFSVYESEAEEMILPELQSGEFVTLQGELTRANTRTGTLGFAYKNHILTSTLVGTTIQDNKVALFDKEVEIDAIVTRQQKRLDAEDDLKRPKLEIRTVRVLGEAQDQKQLGLSLINEDNRDAG